MGITKSSFSLLIEEAKAITFKGKKILQLGRQHTFLTLKQALSLAKKAGIAHSPISLEKIHSSFSPQLAALGYIDDLTLFKILGFEEIHSIDVSPYENATYVHDLNLPIPLELHNQYDVIFDGGTMEHVFSIPQVLTNLHHLLKQGGIIIHASPSHNYVDHGFYMFSPTFFYEYYAQNSYKIIHSYLFESSFENNTSWHVYEYRPGQLEFLSFGGFGKKMLGIWFVAQKEALSTGGKIPQQGAYFHQWSEKKEQKTSQPNRLIQLIKKSKWLHSNLLRARKTYTQYKARKAFRKNKIGIF